MNSYIYIKVTACNNIFVVMAYSLKVFLRKFGVKGLIASRLSDTVQVNGYDSVNHQTPGFRHGRRNWQQILHTRMGLLQTSLILFSGEWDLV